MSVHKAMTIKAALLAALTACALSAHAQTWPAKPVRFVLPIAPGTAPDKVTRLVGERLRDKWGQQIVVENRPSAGLIVGTELVAKSAPDGYTLLSTLTSHVQAPSLYKSLPFNTLADFAPITQLVNIDTIFLVRADLPTPTIKDFIALAKSSPRQLSYGSTGAGQSYHLNMSAIASASGINLLHVPYKGGVEALNDVVGGRVDATFSSLPTAVGMIKANRVRPLAVIAVQRSPKLPDVPTFAEMGIAILPAWFGLLAPKATPEAIVRKVSTDVREILRDPAFAARFADEGVHVVGSSPEEFSAKLVSDVAAWKKIIDAAGIQAE